MYLVQYVILYDKLKLNLTCMNSRENGERDEECEENIEALRETGLEHIPVGDGVDHIAFALLLKGLVVHVVVVAEKSLTKKL